MQGLRHEGRKLRDNRFDLAHHGFETLYRCRDVLPPPMPKLPQRARTQGVGDLRIGAVLVPSVHLVVQRRNGIEQRIRLEGAVHNVEGLCGGARLRARAIEHRGKDGRPTPVHDPVDQPRRDDLTAQAVPFNLGGIIVAHERGEVAEQVRLQRRIIRHAGGDDRVERRQLRVGHEDADLGTRQTTATRDAFFESGTVRQVLDIAIQKPAPFEALHQAFLQGGALGAERLLDRDAECLLLVVVEHELGHRIRHPHEEIVAVLTAQAIRSHGVGECDLDVDLDIGRVDARRIVHRIRVERPARAVGSALQRILDAPVLRDAEIGTLPDHEGAAFVPVDADRIVGAIAHIRVRLVARLDVGADAAEPHQVHARFQDRVQDRLRRMRPFGKIEGAERFGFEFDRLLRARIHAPALRQERAVVVLPRHARRFEQTLSLGKARLVVRVGVDKDVAVVEGRDEADHGRQQHAVAEHIP